MCQLLTNYAVNFMVIQADFRELLALFNAHNLDESVFFSGILGGKEWAQPKGLMKKL